MPLGCTNPEGNKRKRDSFSSNSFPDQIMNQFHKRFGQPTLEQEESMEISPTNHHGFERFHALKAEEEDDMDLQLALFQSRVTQEDKIPEIIDLKRKGIAQQSLTPLPDQWEPCHSRKETAVESSVAECVICKEMTSSRSVLRDIKCRHPFCEDCFRNYVGEKLQEDIYKIMCPEENCEEILRPIMWKRFVPERLLWLRDDEILESSVLANPTFILCPNKDCSQEIVDDGKKFMIRACPKCCKLYCWNCLVPWHEGMECDEFVMELEQHEIFIDCRLSEFQDINFMR